VIHVPTLSRITTSSNSTAYRAVKNYVLPSIFQYVYLIGISPMLIDKKPYNLAD